MKSTVYRASQFLHYWRNAPLNRAAQNRVDAILPTSDMRALFRRLSPGEQAHSLKVLERVLARYPAAPPELLQAALLHDVGKIVAPLTIAERVLVVLGQKLFPGVWAGWGQGSARGWRKAFVVANQHARWGADLAAQAGALALTSSLIRRHATYIGRPVSVEDELLQHLQTADNAS